MKPSLVKAITFLIILQVGVQTNTFSQNNTAAFAAADSSNFSVNSQEDWQLYNSYLSDYKTDSVQMELIVQHDNNINWSVDQYIGIIKYAPLLPQTDQSIQFNLLSDGYILRIETTGKCYLHFLAGYLPSANPVVIPIKVYYSLL
jgi:hypothetical protein